MAGTQIFVPSKKLTPIVCLDLLLTELFVDHHTIHQLVLMNAMPSIDLPRFFFKPLLHFLLVKIPIFIDVPGKPLRFLSDNELDSTSFNQ